MTSRTLNILSAAKVQAIREAGRYSDGGGLFLYVDATRRNWIFRYTWRGGRKELGLGSARSLSLANAREKAAEYRAMLAEGKNPRRERDRGTEALTFGDFADAFIDTMSAGWKNPKHIAQWRMTLTVYAAPLRELFLHEIDTDDVLGVLKPICLTRSCCRADNACQRPLKSGNGFADEGLSGDVLCLSSCAARLSWV